MASIKSTIEVEVEISVKFKECNKNENCKFCEFRKVDIEDISNALRNTVKRALESTDEEEYFTK